MKNILKFIWDWHFTLQSYEAITDEDLWWKVDIFVIRMLFMAALITLEVRFIWSLLNP